MTAKIIDGKQVAKDIRTEIADGVQKFKARYNITPGLAVVLVGDDPASAVYVRNKQKAATEIGMFAQDIHLPAQTTMAELLGHVESINKDRKFHGMIVQLPLPSHLDENTIIEAINPLKDADGLHPVNVGLLVEGRERFIAATPAGIQQLLLRYGYDPAGKHVVVVGRSEIVGKPVAILLMQKQKGANATVTVCHSRTVDLPKMTRQADILIAAIGRARFITADMVKEGAVVIDVGTNRADDPASKSGYKLVGDVDFDAVVNKAEAITPVPGGVGPMTIAMLLSNTLKAAKLSVGA